VILLDDINGKFSDNNKVSYSFHKWSLNGLLIEKCFIHCHAQHF
jgi:hypothetical protein